VSLSSLVRRFVLVILMLCGCRGVLAAEPIVLDPKIIFAKCLVPPTSRSHKTYVVSPTGDDAGAGSEAAPFRTIQHAANLVLPGDTVLIRAGTYADETEPGQRGVVVSRSGAPDAWITFKAYPGTRPLITSATYVTFEIRDAAYIEVSGLEFTTTTLPAERKNVGAGLSGTHSHHIRFRDNIVRDCGGSGIETKFCDYATIEHNRVSGNSFFNIYNCSGISLWEGRDFDNQPGFHNIIRGNTSYANENKGPTPLYGGSLTDGNGIIIDWNRGQAATLIENNLCFDNGGRGVCITHSDNILIRNNTLWGNGRTDGSQAAWSVGSTKILYVNNILVGRSGQTAQPDSHPGPDVVYRNNLVFNYTAIPNTLLTGSPSNLLGVDPRFVAASADPAVADFHLAPNSPAIKAGDSSSVPANDLDGKRRSQGKPPTLGAYEQ
jgi:parallel beta-helix repeat protein